MKMTNCYRRDIFLEIFVTFSMIKASLSFHVHVTLLAWFTVKSLIYVLMKAITQCESVVTCIKSSLIFQIPRFMLNSKYRVISPLKYIVYGL